MIDNSCRHAVMKVRHAVMKVMGSDHRVGKGHHQLRDKGVDTEARMLMRMSLIGS